MINNYSSNKNFVAQTQVFRVGYELTYIYKMHLLACDSICACMPTLLFYFLLSAFCWLAVALRPMSPFARQPTRLARKLIFRCLHVISASCLSILTTFSVPTFLSCAFKFSCSTCFKYILLL